MPKFFIKHVTHYNYSNLVIDGASQIMLHPIEDDYQKVPSHTLSVNTNPKIKTRKDFFDNTVGSFMVIEPHDFLSIISEIEVITQHRPYPENINSVSEQWDYLKVLKTNPEFIDYLKYLDFDGTAEIETLLSTRDLTTETPYSLVMFLSEYIFTNFKYIQGVTNVDSKLDHAWSLKAGVCQDFAYILLQMVRMAGIPARYVSGYICPNESCSRGEGATHAWIEAYIPDHGWLGIDPTNNAIANEYHVKLAVGRNYKDCTPVKGVFKGNATAELHVNVEVRTEKNTLEAIETPLPQTEKPINRNSYRKSLEALQQQQEQQQQ